MALLPRKSVGARHGNAICRRTPGIAPDSDSGAPKCTRPSHSTKAPKYVLVLNPFTLSSRHAVDLPPLNNPTPKQAFLSKNYDEDARRADSDQRGIFRTLTNSSAAPAPGLIRLLGTSSFSLPTVERTLMEMEGSSGLERRVVAGPQTSGARQV